MRRLFPVLIPALLFLTVMSCSSYSIRKESGNAGTETSTDYSASEAVTTEEPGNDASVYTVKNGDTLDSIALATLGNRALSRHLREWNKIPGDRQPEPGTRIMIPLKFRGLLGVKSGGATLHVESRPAPPPGAPNIPRYRAKHPSKVVRVGEKLTFDVKWYAIKAGQAVLSVESLGDAWGRRVYHFVAVAQSTLVFFFKVNDSIESYSTEDELLPVRFEKHLREGSYKKDIVATFDLAKMEVMWGDKAGPLGPNCRDLLGAFEYFRTIPLPEAGKESVVGVHTDRKNYELWVQVVKRERIKVPAGEFNTVCIKPKLKFGGLWRQKGDILIWLTDDDRRLPVLVVSKVFLLGSVDIVLVKMEGTK